jgi:hypothetical protein
VPTGKHPDGAAEQLTEDEFAHERGTGIDGQELRSLGDASPAIRRRMETFDHDEPPCSEE